MYYQLHISMVEDEETDRIAETGGSGFESQWSYYFQHLSSYLNGGECRIKCLVKNCCVTYSRTQILWSHGPVWSGRYPVTVEIAGSNPVGIA